MDLPNGAEASATRRGDVSVSGSKSPDSPRRPVLPSGYIDVPRYLRHALRRAPHLSGSARRIIDVIVDLTWGYYPDDNWSGARISRSTIAELADLPAGTVNRIMHELLEEEIVVEPWTSARSGRRASTLRLNPDPATWGRYTPFWDWTRYEADISAARNEAAALESRTGKTGDGPPVEYPTLSTLQAEDGAAESSLLGTQGTQSWVPTVLTSEHSTGSLKLPSLNLPLDELPSVPSSHSENPTTATTTEPAPQDLRELFRSAYKAMP